MSDSKDKDPALIHPGLKSLEYINPKLGSMYFRFNEGEGLRYMPSNAFLLWKSLPSSQSADNRPFYVFIHDYGSSSRIFNKLASRVKHHCLAVDLRGWGRSDHTKDEAPRAYSVAQMKNDLPRVIDLLQGEKFVLVGHGMGAKVAQLFAAQQPPKNLVGLILFAPAPLSSWNASKEIIEKYQAAYKTRKHLEKFTKKILAHSPIDEVDLRNLVDDGMKDTPLAKDAWLSYGMKDDYSHGLGKIKVPALVWAGEYDRLISIKDVEREVSEKIKLSLLLSVKNCGHLLLVEDAVAAGILDAFSKNPERLDPKSTT